MKKLILSMMTSLDGLIEGPNKELDWHVWGKEMDQYMSKFFNNIDCIIMGRVTYELMESYWPKASEPTDDPIITERMNNLPKLVFSRTRSNSKWNNSRFINGDLQREITKLKGQPGNDMVMFGGADLASQLAQLGLFDIYHIIVNPVLLGRGKPLFPHVTGKHKLKLTGTKVFDCGNVILKYVPDKN